MHTVSVRAFDAAGNARSAAVTVTRVRSGAPDHGATSASAEPAPRRPPREPERVPRPPLTLVRALVGGEHVAHRQRPGRTATARCCAGRGTSGRSATVSLTRCGDSSGAIAAVVQLDAGADGTLYARQPADGLCVLRIKPFGEA